MTRSTTGLLHQAARAVVRAGGEVRMPARAASWRTFEVAGQQYPYDLEPAVQASGKRSVDLQTEGNWAETVTLVFGYEGRSEVTPSVGVVVPIPVRDLYPRRHAAVVRFGTGQANHSIEVDVAEGTVVSLPTQSVEVTLVSYGAVFPLVPQPPQVWASRGSAAYGVCGGGVKTQGCLVPVGLYSMPGAGVAGQALSRLADAGPATVEDVFVAAMARPVAIGGPTAAYRAAVERVLALVPPDEPILGVA